MLADDANKNRSIATTKHSKEQAIDFGLVKRLKLRKRLFFHCNAMKTDFSLDFMLL